MIAWRQGALAVLVLLSTTAGFAGDDPAAGLEEARRLLDLGRHAEAAEAFERYAKAHPRAADVSRAYVGAFDAWLAAGEDDRAQKAGKRVLAKHPDAHGTFPVLAAWVGRGWKVPRLGTSYEVLHAWTFDRIDGGREPDLRLAFLDILAKQHKREDLVRDKGILYCRAWAHAAAGRPEEAIACGRKYLRAEPEGDYADRVRFVVARALLALDPPRTDDAAAVLRVMADDPASPSRERAQALLQETGRGPASIQITAGCPTPEGLGRMVLLTNLGKRDARLAALAPWIAARETETVRFRGRDVEAVAGKLRRIGPEYVAVVVAPADLDNDFQLSMLELCRDLDEDPMPDFHFGYLVARDAEDLAALARRILAKEAEGGTQAKVVGLPTSAASVDGLDFFLHYGHGTARGIVKGASAAEVAGWPLARAPVVFSGACFNGVCARTHERHSLANHHGRPEELAVEDALALAWLHAGATGLLAALDGDRGEMAAAEWEHFLEHAPPLGAVIGYQYRLVFTSLPESFEGFPRYVPGQRKDKSFYGVMLRGQTSRILISDPMYRPLHESLGAPTTTTDVAHDASTGQVTVRVEMLRRSNGPFVNTLPTKAGTPFKETRLYVRVPLPDGVTGTLGFPEVDAGDVTLSRIQAKHEVWGGRRYVNLQAESADWGLTTKGAVTTFTLTPRR